MSRDAIDYAYSLVADSYDDYYSDPSDIAESRVMYGWAMAAWRKSPAGQFIDLGCGPGSALNFIRPPRHYLGLDICEKMVARARADHPGYEFAVGSECDLADKSAGFIFGGFGPLMHVQNLGEFTRHIRRALIPSGRFMLSCAETRVTGDTLPAIRRDAQTLSKAFSWADDLRVGGLRWLTPKSLPVALQTTMLRAEARVVPTDRCRFRIVSGRK